MEKSKEGWSEKSFIATCDDRRVFVKFDISLPALERLALLGVAPEVFARGEYRGRFKVVASATVLIWKILRVAESRWRRLDAPEFLKDVYEGRRFVDGRPITRAIGKEAA